MPPEPESEIPESFDDWLYDPPSLPEGHFLPPWAWWVIAGVALAASIFSLFNLARRLRIPPIPPNPRDSAIQEIDALGHRAETLLPAEMGSNLVSAINRYFHRRYGELAEFRTREELFDPACRPAGCPPLPPGVSERFTKLMESCEEMRFAGKKSSAKSRGETISAAVNTIREEPA